MPKEMLIEKAAALREIADALESYAGEDASEESSEPMSEGIPTGEASSASAAPKSSKVKMALMAMKKGT